MCESTSDSIEHVDFMQDPALNPVMELMTELWGEEEEPSAEPAPIADDPYAPVMDPVPDGLPLPDPVSPVAELEANSPEGFPAMPSPRSMEEAAEPEEGPATEAEDEDNDVEALGEALHRDLTLSQEGPSESALSADAVPEPDSAPAPAPSRDSSVPALLRASPLSESGSSGTVDSSQHDPARARRAAQLARLVELQNLSL